MLAVRRGKQLDPKGLVMHEFLFPKPPLKVKMAQNVIVLVAPQLFIRQTFPNSKPHLTPNFRAAATSPTDSVLSTL